MNAKIVMLVLAVIVIMSPIVYAHSLIVGGGLFVEIVLNADSTDTEDSNSGAPLIAVDSDGNGILVDVKLILDSGTPGTTATFTDQVFSISSPDNQARATLEVYLLNFPGPSLALDPLRGVFNFSAPPSPLNVAREGEVCWAYLLDDELVSETLPASIELEGTIPPGAGVEVEGDLELDVAYESPRRGTVPVECSMAKRVTSKSALDSL